MIIICRLGRLGGSSFPYFCSIFIHICLTLRHNGRGKAFLRKMVPAQLHYARWRMQSLNRVHANLIKYGREKIYVCKWVFGHVYIILLSVRIRLSGTRPWGRRNVGEKNRTISLQSRPFCKHQRARRRSGYGIIFAPTAASIPSIHSGFSFNSLFLLLLVADICGEIPK